MKTIWNGLKSLVLIPLFLSINLFLHAQTELAIKDTRPMNNLNVNFLGEGSLISFNYERLFKLGPGLLFAGQFGVGHNEEFDLHICLFGPCNSPPASSEKYLTLAQRLTGMVGSGILFFEFGVGGTLILGDKNSTYIVYPLAGLRIQPQTPAKLNLRLFGCFAGSGGVVEVAENSVFFIPFGLSLGYCF